MILYKLAKNKSFQKKLWKEMIPRLKQALQLAIFSASMYTLLSFYGITSLVILPLILLWGAMKNYKPIATIVALLFAIIFNPILSLQNIMYSSLLFVGAFTLIKLLFSMRPLLSKEISVSKLEEGMIPAKGLIKKGTKIIESETINFSSILKYAKAGKINDLFFPTNEIVSSRKARGLTIDELKEVKALSRAGKIPKTIFVKDTMPFVPTVLLGYIMCLLLGDAWLILVLGLA
jgi:prepilin signal peptidase PulO-like enzyme (type II secretory pathway)